MGKRKTNLERFDDQRNMDSLLAKREEGVVYVGINPIYLAIRMEWMDDSRHVQVREEPCEGGYYCAEIMRTLRRMYEEHLKSNFHGIEVEDMGKRTGIITIETNSEKRGRRQYLQDLLRGEDPEIIDDWHMEVDISDCFE